MENTTKTARTHATGSRNAGGIVMNIFRLVKTAPKATNESEVQIAIQSFDLRQKMNAAAIKNARKVVGLSVVRYPAHKPTDRRS